MQTWKFNFRKILVFSCGVVRITMQTQIFISSKTWFWVFHQFSHLTTEHQTYTELIPACCWWDLSQRLHCDELENAINFHFQCAVERIIHEIKKKFILVLFTFKKFNGAREGEWSLSHYYANFVPDAIPMRSVYVDFTYCYADTHPRLFIEKKFDDVVGCLYVGVFDL